jgi:uridylate kinase
MEKEKKIIISLGGSMIVPNGLDAVFISKFKKLILKWVEKSHRFYIVTGGGKTCRNYNDALKQIVNPTNEDLDWLGISATRLNAEFVRICFKDKAYEKIIMSPDEIPETDKPILVGGGWKPGNSSDLAAVHMAKSVGSNTVINLSSVDFIYDSDPKQNPDAKKFEKISWSEYLSFISNEWNPGMNLPFDPIASKEAQVESIEVIFIGGHNLESLDLYLKGEEFIGTIIK